MGTEIYLLDDVNREAPSRELVALLAEWLAARDVVRLASEWTFDPTEADEWKAIGWATVRPPGVSPTI